MSGSSPSPLRLGSKLPSLTSSPLKEERGNMINNFTTNAARLAGQVSLALGWRPDEFWNTTPCELSAILAAMEAPVHESIPSREHIAQLMKEFPDG